MSTYGALALCQNGYEGLLSREMGLLGQAAAATGPGWAATAAPQGGVPAPGAAELGGCAFAHAVLESPVAAAGDTVNRLAAGVMDIFAGGVRGERVDGPWTCQFSCGHDVAGLGRRVASVEGAFHELLRRKLGRVARLATAQRPRTGAARGLFAWFTGFGTVLVSRTAFFNGQARMADDDAAPSRSYLKVEESYGILGSEPCPGETVCDLGAAPGGWSYSAAKRGARVVAVDNGPLKGGALANPLVEHRRADAFGFSPGKDAVYDWLFCDMLEEPQRVMESVVLPWLRGGWCRRFVVNLKFGRVDPIALLSEIRSPRSPFAALALGARFVHLYHDREEFTVVGRVAP